MKSVYNKLHPEEEIVTGGRVGFMGPPDAMENPSYE